MPQLDPFNIYPIYCMLFIPSIVFSLTNFPLVFLFKIDFYKVNIFSFSLLVDVLGLL